MASIFSQIIAGDIPSHSVYEDEHTYAFLDINPRAEGHTLVVPKREVDYLFDLPDEDYSALWKACATVSRAIKAATGCKRVVAIVLGYEVPHAHVHLIPTNELSDVPFPPVAEAAKQTFEATATRIRAAVG